jgi:hypothetical protein
LVVAVALGACPRVIEARAYAGLNEQVVEVKRMLYRFMLDWLIPDT